MRTFEQLKNDRGIREPSAESEPMAFRRSTTVAVVLAAIGVIGMVVLIAAALFAILGLIYSPVAWSGLVPAGLGRG